MGELIVGDGHQSNLLELVTCGSPCEPLPNCHIAEVEAMSIRTTKTP